jgi:hypothetical protein
METIYEELTTELGGKIIERTDVNGIVSFIPIDFANSDYQAYLNRDNSNYGKQL